MSTRIRVACASAIVLPLVVGVAAACEPDPAAGIVRIDVVPTKVTLRSARETAQLIVTGYDSEGRTRDLTHAARIVARDDRTVAVRRGRVAAVGDGATTLSVRIGRQETEVDVAVAQVRRPDPVRFRSEVLPALTKQGCNAGSCHGAPEGKGGFALSMLAYKPSIDEESLTTGGLARRIEPLSPQESLLLRKPMLRVTHVGGKRLRPDDAAYAVLRDWIAEGARLDSPDAPACVGITVFPGPSRTIVAPHLRQQLRVVAEFADGTTRDVTRSATYASSNEATVAIDADGLVSGDERGSAAVTVRYLDFVRSIYFTVIRPVDGFAAAWTDPAANNYVDDLVHARLKQLQFVPSPSCDDATFVRRIHLDLTGLLPTVERVRSFLADRAPDKRSRLVDQLLASEEFARFWARKEADLYRVNPQMLDADLMKSDGARLLEGRAALFNEWLVDQWRRNTPYDRHVRALLTATGDTRVVGPANFFEAIPKQEDVSEATAQLFMGSRINCAKCHNHPFESWTQDDYYRIVAVFARVRRADHEIALADVGEAVNPGTGKVMSPWGRQAAAPSAGKPEADRRVIFTEWLTRSDDPLFARVAVNRIWAHLLGRGIVHPVDDFRSSNPPTNPELLDALAADFRKHGFDRKHVIRTICNSRTYQRSTATHAWNVDDVALFSHFIPRRLTGEQLRDALGYVAGTLPAVERLPAELRKLEAEIAARSRKMEFDQHAFERDLHRRLQSRPIRFGPWHASDAFPAANIEKAHAERFAPETEPAVDLEARVAGPGDTPAGEAAPGAPAAASWRPEHRWFDGRDLPLDMSGVGARYFRTVLHVRETGTALLSLTSDAAVRVVVDGRERYDSGIKSVAKESTKEIELRLEPGEHRLLIKVVGNGGTKRLRTSLRTWNGKLLEPLDVRADAVEILAQADALPNVLRAIVLEHRLEADAELRRLRDALRRTRHRTAYRTQHPFPERDPFAEAFGQPKRETACACERTSDPTLDQALHLLNGAETQTASEGGARRFVRHDDTSPADELYLAAFARPPRDAERAVIDDLLKRSSDRTQAVRDLLWSVFNTREFLFQH